MEDILFDMEIFEKIKYQEEIVDMFDFKETIQAFIQSKNHLVSRSILQLVSEKMLVDRKIPIDLFAYYTTVIFYCCWKPILQGEVFEDFVKEENLVILQQVIEQK